MVALGLSRRPGVESRDEARIIADVDACAARDGRPPAAYAIWVDWGDLGDPAAPRWTMPSLPTLQALDDRGVCPVIFWQPVLAGNAAVPFADIVAGTWDAYIDAFAAACAAFGKRVIVRFAHEGNAPWFPWAIGKAGNTAANCRAAHRYVHDRVRPIAPQVAFFWCPMAPKAGYVPLEDLYPGNAWCQFVGFDSYQWSGSQGQHPVDQWQPSIRALRDLTGGGKPIIVGETGVRSSGDPDHGDFRRAWLRDGFRAAQAEWPILAAILYFDVDVRNIDEPDWRIGSVPNLKAAWKGLMADPMFQGTLR
jgi:hypothetical protein